METNSFEEPYSTDDEIYLQNASDEDDNDNTFSSSSTTKLQFRYKKEIYELVKKRSEEADNVNEVINNFSMCVISSSSITDGLVLGLALAFILGVGLPFGAKLFTRDVDVLHLIKIGILMVITTLGDLHGLYPGIILQNKVLRIKDKSTDQYIYMEDFSLDEMASSQNVELEAANFLHKLIQDSKDEPAKLATKLHVILQHMKSSGKEHSMPYQMISRAKFISAEERIAIAGEAGLPFFAANGTDFVEMFAGVAASRVKDLFLLPSPVLVIGATNRLDIPALLRKGRFDKIIRVGLPSKDGRFSILKVICSSDNLCIMKLASRSISLSVSIFFRV
ncbi:hypothetical protein HN51_044973 [Arachis hypogaea]